MRQKQFRSALALFARLTLAATLVAPSFARAQVETGPAPEGGFIEAAPMSEAIMAELMMPWAFDPGPNVRTRWGRGMVDHVSAMPFMPGISPLYLGQDEQKFRPAFGPTLWRMSMVPNSIQVLVIGQDGTHIAEAAGKTATAGFGGRAQDMTSFLGVRNGVAFINWSAFTIQGQYGAAATPVVKTGPDGKKSVNFMNVVDNGLWGMSQDPKSSMAHWRNELIKQIIANNKDSLKMVIVLGGAARDSMGSLLESLGKKVATKYSAEDLKSMKVVQTRMEYAGGNNEFAAAVDRDGKDIYATAQKKRVDYKNAKMQQDAQKYLQANIDKILPQLGVSEGGLNGSGVMHPAQIGGYVLTEGEGAEKRAVSLKGLEVLPGITIPHDLLVIAAPHPTYLSNVEMEKGPEAVAKLMKDTFMLTDYYKARGWAIIQEPGAAGGFMQGQAYKYGRTDLPQAHYSACTPNCRTVPKSDAVRLDANEIVVGTRDKAPFDNAERARVEAALPLTPLNPLEMFTMRPRTVEARYIFDPGPPAEFAKLLKSLDIRNFDQPKVGMTFEKDGIAAYDVKSHPNSLGDFAHYRGTFENPEVLIMADPAGWDDVATSRALTGARGQFLQGMLEDLGINEKYLVLKTVPFQMDDATREEWDRVLGKTNKYREDLMRLLLSKGTPKLIFADGENAAKETQRILALLGATEKVQVVDIRRDGSKADAGLLQAAQEASQILKRPMSYRGKASHIPRSHVDFITRIWQGTCGIDMVLNSTDKKYRGEAVDFILPKVFMEQKLALTADETARFEQHLADRRAMRLPLPGETIHQAEARMAQEKASLAKVIPLDAMESRKSTPAEGVAISCEAALNF